MRIERIWDWRRWWRSAMVMGILGVGIRSGSNLLLLPIVLRKLSVPQYDMWLLFLTLGNFANLADFGFGAAIPRLYSYLWAGAEEFDAEGMPASHPDRPPNFHGIRRLNATVGSLYVKLSVIAILLLALVGTPFLKGGTAEAWWLWPVFLIAIGYNLATSYWLMASHGLNRVRELEVASILSGLGYFCCASVLLLLGAGLSAMVVATFLQGLILRQSCRRACLQVIPPSERKEEPDPEIIRKLWPNAYRFGLGSLGGYLLMSSPFLICKQFYGLGDITASYGLMAQVGGFMTKISGLWLVVKWPQITILRTQGQLRVMAVLFARRLVLTMASFVALGVVVFFAGNTSLGWMGTHKRLLGHAYLGFYLIYLTQNIFYVQFGTLVFTENVVPFFKISVFTGVGACFLGLMLTPYLGLWGLLIAPLMAETMCSNWYIVRRGFRGQPLTLAEFVRAPFSGKT